VKFFQAYGVPLADHWEWFKFLFLQRYGKINSSQSYYELQNLRMGEKESVLNFVQRLRGKVYEANVVDENVMVTIFINALPEPLKNQVSTRMPVTLEHAIHDAEYLNHRIRSQAIAQEATLALAKAAIKPKETPEEKPRRAARAVVRAVEDDPAPTDKKGEADRKEPRPLPVNRDQKEKSSGRDQGGERRDNRNGQRSTWNGQRRDEGRPRQTWAHATRLPQPIRKQGCQRDRRRLRPVLRLQTQGRVRGWLRSVRGPVQ
jgi:hypothetical protein